MGFFEDFFMGTKGTPASRGVDTVYYDDYEDYAGIRKGLVDYWQGAQAGNEPEWLTKYSDQLLAGQMRGIEQDFMGREGDRSNSALGLSGQVDASRGTGKATTTNRTIQSMMDKKYAAREASAGYRQNAMGKIVSEAGQSLSKLPQGQRADSFGWQDPGIAGSPGFLKEKFGTIMGNLGPQSLRDVADIAGTFFRGKAGTGGTAPNSTVPGPQGGTITGYDPDLAQYPAAQ